MHFRITIRRSRWNVMRRSINIMIGFFGVAAVVGILALPAILPCVLRGAVNLTILLLAAVTVYWVWRLLIPIPEAFPIQIVDDEPSKEN